MFTDFHLLLAGAGAEAFDAFLTPLVFHDRSCVLSFESPYFAVFFEQRRNSLRAAQGRESIGSKDCQDCQGPHETLTRRRIPGVGRVLDYNPLFFIS